MADDSPPPSTTPSASSSPPPQLSAAALARQRREARRAKILAGGADRLSRITNTFSRAAAEVEAELAEERERRSSADPSSSSSTSDAGASDSRAAVDNATPEPTQETKSDKTKETKGRADETARSKSPTRKTAATPDADVPASPPKAPGSPTRSAAPSLKNEHEKIRDELQESAGVRRRKGGAISGSASTDAPAVSGGRTAASSPQETPATLHKSESHTNEDSLALGDDADEGGDADGGAGGARERVPHDGWRTLHFFATLALCVFYLINMLRGYTAIGDEDSADENALDDDTSSSRREPRCAWGYMTRQPVDIDGLPTLFTAFLTLQMALHSAHMLMSPQKSLQKLIMQQPSSTEEAARLEDLRMKYMLMSPTMRTLYGVWFSYKDLLRTTMDDFWLVVFVLGVAAGVCA